MRPENEAKLKKLKRISRFLQVLCVFYIVSCVLVVWSIARGPIYTHGLWWGNGTAWYMYGGVGFKVYSLTAHERLIATVSFALYWGMATLCGFQLFHLLGFYSRGEIFTQRAAGQIRRLGLATVAWGLVKLGYYFVPLLIPNSRRTEGVTLSTIGYGLIIVVISWFMEMAAEMQEEQDLTV